MELTEFFFNNSIAIYIILVIFCILVIASTIYLNYRIRKMVFETVDTLKDGTAEISAKEFLRVRGYKQGRKIIMNQYDFEGVFILHNITKDKYYAGKSKNVLKRLCQILIGSRNDDIHKDFTKGNEIVIKATSLDASGCKTTSELEEKMLKDYSDDTIWYNKRKKFLL